jgi:hypothetical protein
LVYLVEHYVNFTASGRLMEWRCPPRNGLTQSVSG